MSQRYQIVPRSTSAHCCFDFTIVDTSRPKMANGKQYIDVDYGPQFETVCECFDEKSARLVAEALNQCAPTSATSGTSSLP